MSEALAPYFRGRLGAWVGLLCYVLMDVALKCSVWLDAAPENLSSVTQKQWLGLVLLVIAGVIKTARSYVSGSWGESAPDTHDNATTPPPRQTPKP